MIFLIYIITLSLVLFFIFSAILTVLPMVKGAPFVPTADSKLKDMLKLLKVKEGEQAADLGSGNGKIVIALAQQGAIAHGFEVNPFLVLYSKRKIRALGLQDRAFIHLKSLWKEDYSKYDILTLYGISYIMPGLEKKLGRELKKSARLVSNYFQFPDWKPIKKSGVVLLYQR